MDKISRLERGIGVERKQSYSNALLIVTAIVVLVAVVVFAARAMGYQHATANQLQQYKQTAFNRVFAELRYAKTAELCAALQHNSPARKAVAHMMLHARVFEPSGDYPWYAKPGQLGYQHYAALNKERAVSDAVKGKCNLS